MKKISVRKITETAIIIALAFVIDLLFELIPFLNWPEGGHVSPAMLAIIINGFRNGWKCGLAGGIIFSILSWLFGGMVLHVGSIFLDYLLAYGVLGLSGLFQKQGKNLFQFCLIVFILCFIRYLSSSFSGVLFFKQYAYVPDYLDWELEGDKLYWVYSFVIYNLPYLASSTILCIIVGIVLHKRHLIYKGTEIE